MSRQYPLSENPAVDVLKRVGSSPLLLWAGIFQSAFFAAWIGFIAAFSNMFATLIENAPQPDGIQISPEFAESSARIGRTFLCVLFSLPLIPVALSLVGLWIHYAACRSVKSGGVSTAGLTVWKVLNYIQLVAVCSVAGIFLILVIMALVFSVTGGYDALGSKMPSSALAVLWFVYLLLIAGFSSLPVIESALKIRLINRTKAVAHTGSPDNRTPTFVVVVNYIKAVFLTMYGILFVPMSLLPAMIPAEAAVNVPNLTSFLLMGIAMLFQAAYLVLVNVSISRYKQKMTRVIYPQYPQAWIPVQPAPYAPPAPPVYTQPAAPVQPAAPEETAAPAEPAEPENTEDGPQI